MGTRLQLVQLEAVVDNSYHQRSLPRALARLLETSLLFDFLISRVTGSRWVWVARSFSTVATDIKLSIFGPGSWSIPGWHWTWKPA